MCVIRGSLTITTSLPNEARFSLESKTAIPTGADVCIVLLLRLRGRSGFDRVGTRHADKLTYIDHLKVWRLR